MMCVYLYQQTNKNTEKMKTFNKAITLETARELVRSINSAFPNTQHNREMVATATREIIRELHATK